MRRIALMIALPVAVAVGCADMPTGPLPVGTWGGTGASLVVSASSASLELDCAHGTIDVPVVTSEGRFELPGRFVREHGGPLREDEKPVELPATYEGSLDGDRLELRITLTDEPVAIGPFRLVRGRDPLLRKCL